MTAARTAAIWQDLAMRHGPADPVAYRRLSTALARAEDDGATIPCRGGSSWAWTAAATDEAPVDKAARDWAAGECTRCPVLVQCAAAGEGEAGTWGGTERSIPAPGTIRSRRHAERAAEREATTASTDVAGSSRAVSATGDSEGTRTGFGYFEAADGRTAPASKWDRRRARKRARLVERRSSA